MHKFEILDHTADIGVAAYGATLEELFANAALGMFTIVGDPTRVAPREEREVHVRSDDIESLLAAFLAELLYLFEVGRFMPHRTVVQAVSDNEIRATVHGEPVSPLHDLTTDIKAVTHHGLLVEKRDDLWRATVLFDV